MRKVLLSLAATLACAGALATPALANEARVEARGGVIWAPGDTQATAGVAAGYDFDMGPGAFVGLEGSADKILEGGTRVAFGFTGRAGVKATPSDKLFVAGGYTTKPCRDCEGAEHLGAGIEHTFLGNVYGKVEYRHFFTEHGAPDSNSVAAGVGLKF